VLLFGDGDTDPLFLQVKEAIVPVHAAWLPAMTMREQHQGRRVVDALGYTRIDGRDYFGRQMKNMKASVPVSLTTGERFDFWAFTCGSLLARTDERYGDAARIAATAARTTRTSRWATSPRRMATRPSRTTASS